MTDIEQKALTLVNEVFSEHTKTLQSRIDRLSNPYDEALCRAIEQHEAFRQEVSDAAEHLCKFYGVPIVRQQLERFIITKPDPLVEVMNEWWNSDGYASIETFRTALAKRGLEIREKSE